MSIMICTSCEDPVDTDIEDYDFENDMCIPCFERIEE